MATDQDKQNGEEKEQNLWSEILNDVAASSARNRPQLTKTLLVLGDINSGKSTLVDKLCQISKTKPQGSRALSGCGLEYRYIDVQDEETDDLIDRMSVWILDGVVWHSSLLPFALNKNSIMHTTVMLVVDMSQPWAIPESLDRWADVLRKHIDSLKIEPKTYAEMRKSLVKQFQSYVDPEEKHDPVVASMGEEGSVDLPLGETTLTSNLGVPIVVVCAKSDSVVDLEKTHGYRDEHFDFIQQAVRKFCLNFGASLFYTTMKDDKNLQIMHKYLLHRSYGMPFKESAWVIDKDAIFIPSGWDTEKKIAILHESMKSFNHEQEYEEVIIAPKSTQVDITVGTVEAEDEQVFLVKLQAHIAKSPRTAPSTPATPQSTSTSKLAYSPSSQQQGGGESEKADGETVLANFFNSLLTSKKPLRNSATSVTTNSSRTTSRNEASAEMDKLMKKS